MLFRYVLILFFTAFYTVIVAASVPDTGKKEAVIGVLAFRSKADTLTEWQPLAIYLNSKIPSHHFSIRPLSYAEFNEAAASDKLDFMFSNPEHYIYLSAKFGASRMATLIRANVGDRELTEFGGVIIARSDRKDIQQLNDLKGKEIVAVDELSLGGYLAQRAVLQENGIDITKESTIQYTDMPHDKVVYIVESGSADVGFIRTGVLEKMAKEGKINYHDFKIIHPMRNFPQALSTPLYPEWPFAASKHTERVLANQVGVALLNLPYGSEITKSAGYYGWNIPLTYEGIRTLMQTLRIKPYDAAPAFSLQDVIQKYALVVILLLSVVITLLIFLTTGMRHLANTLRLKSDSLEKQISIVQETEKYLRRAANVFHNSREGIIITDPQKVIIDVNEAFCELTGYDRDEVIGQKPILLRSGMHDKQFYEKLDDAIVTHGSWRGEIWNRKKSGERYAEFLRIDAVRDGEGAIENYIGIFSDITEHLKRQEQLHHMANYDPLTNLPNRHLFMTLAEQILSFSKRKNTKAVISFLDLDGFKQVNDLYGHAIGDRVLKEVADRLGKQLRQSDAIARIGGDEFVVIFSDIDTLEDVQPLFERMLKTLKEPFSVNENVITIGASIGASLYPDHGEEVEMLVRHADAAMYRSKENGRNQVTYFDQEKMGRDVL
ncbi:diguanylate cyclase [Sulfuricurvum sp.]|uniref:diguanylate cyclase domain-containing protein n=1 Tax=Sulfuricurvum sp. TaxID=2025608 RepID=UPI00260185D6|nr:diguanylate cyclase [Sulfuricurvum sp.]MDD2780247.1 diguanylate cyclase [Sulfuricurvum sp.]